MINGSRSIVKFNLLSLQTYIFELTCMFLIFYSNNLIIITKVFLSHLKSLFVTLCKFTNDLVNGVQFHVSIEVPNSTIPSRIKNVRWDLILEALNY